MSARHRLEEERRSLQAEWDERNEKLRMLKIALAREATTAVKVQLQGEIKDEELALDALKTRLEQIEGELAEGATDQNAAGTENTRRSVENPFYPLTGRIEQAELFFNRQQELREIFDLLNAGSSVELLGEQQIGKSSVLWQVKLQAKTALKVARQPIYLNLQEVHSEVEFYQSFCEKLGVCDCTGYELSRELQQQRVLLLLDEAEKMTAQEFTRSLRDQLRGLAEGEHSPLKLVVSTQTPLKQLFPNNHNVGRTSPLHELCLPVELKHWDRNIAIQFVESRLNQVSLRFTNQELEELWISSLGHPQKLMKACFDLFQQHRYPND